LQLEIAAASQAVAMLPIQQCCSVVCAGYKLSNDVFVFRAAIGGEKEDGSKKFVIRPYTPTSPKDAKGYFDLVVKVYEQGKMSKHFGELKVLIFS